MFKIKATASGGSELTKIITAQIVVCKSEEIRVQTSSLTYQLDQSSTDIMSIELLNKWISSDPECPAFNFTITPALFN